jgi:hypothetical protein
MAFHLPNFNAHTVRTDEWLFLEGHRIFTLRREHMGAARFSSFFDANRGSAPHFVQCGVVTMASGRPTGKAMPSYTARLFCAQFGPVLGPGLLKTFRTARRKCPLSMVVVVVLWEAFRKFQRWFCLFASVFAVIDAVMVISRRRMACYVFWRLRIAVRLPTTIDRVLQTDTKAYSRLIGYSQR